MFVLSGGPVAGTLDITYACLFWALKGDVPAERILQGVAAGLLGEASFEGGKEPLISIPIALFAQRASSLRSSLCSSYDRRP